VGTWQFGGEWGRQFQQAEVDAILDKAAEHGMNSSTAECYGDHLAESLVGNYLARHDRSRWIVATKFGHLFNKFMDRTWDLSPAGVQTQLENPCAPCRWKPRPLPIPLGRTRISNTELWEMLHRQKAAAKSGTWDLHCRKGGPFQAQRATSVGAEALQVVYNRLERRAETDFFPPPRNKTLASWPACPWPAVFCPQIHRRRPFPLRDVRSTFDQDKLRSWAAESQAIQKPKSTRPPHVQWALKWCLQNPLVSCVIPAARMSRNWSERQGGPIIMGGTRCARSLKRPGIYEHLNRRAAYAVERPRIF